MSNHDSSMQAASISSIDGFSLFLLYILDAHRRFPELNYVLYLADALNYLYVLLEAKFHAAVTKDFILIFCVLIMPYSATIP